MRVGRQSAGFALAVAYCAILSWSNCLDRGCSKLMLCPALSPASRIGSPKIGRPAAAFLRSWRHSTFDDMQHSLDHGPASALLSADGGLSFLNKFLERGQEVSRVGFPICETLYEVG
jgi:hypothetical protein